MLIFFFSSLDTLPRCSLPMEPGPCNGYFPVYYYSACTGTCERFIYGGCFGNKNKFWTKSQCYNTCVGRFLFLHPLEKQRTQHLRRHYNYNIL